MCVLRVWKAYFETFREGEMAEVIPSFFPLFLRFLSSFLGILLSFIPWLPSFLPRFLPSFPPWLSSYLPYFVVPPLFLSDPSIVSQNSSPPPLSLYTHLSLSISISISLSSSFYLFFTQSMLAVDISESNSCLSLALANQRITEGEVALSSKRSVVSQVLRIR